MSFCACNTTDSLNGEYIMDSKASEKGMESFFENMMEERPMLGFLMALSDSTGGLSDRFIPNKMILTNTNLTYITKDDTSQVKCSIVEENNFTKIVVREDDGSDTLLYHKNDKSLNWHGIIYRLKE